MGRKPDFEKQNWFIDAIFRFGIPTPIIVREAGKRWGIGPKRCNDYIVKARKIWRESCPHDLEAIREELDAMNRHLYLKAVEAEDWKAAGSAVRELRELHGAGAAQRVQIETALPAADIAALKEEIRQYLQADPEGAKQLLEANDAIEIVETPPDDGKNGTGLG